jgi:hypothetical protein
VPIPPTVAGIDYTTYLKGQAPAPADAVLLACYQPFGEFNRPQHGGREYRGVRTARYTYTRDLTGPWLLYEDVNDPYQQHNLNGVEGYGEVQAGLDRQLEALLVRYGDEFLPGEAYLQRWGYAVDETGTVPYSE